MSDGLGNGLFPPSLLLFYFNSLLLNQTNMCMHVLYSYSAHIHIVSISNNSQDANLRNYYKHVSSPFLAPSLLLAEFHTQHDELQPGSAPHQMIALCCHTHLQWTQCNLSLEAGKRVSSLTHLLSPVMATPFVSG